MFTIKYYNACGFKESDGKENNNKEDFKRNGHSSCSHKIPMRTSCSNKILIKTTYMNMRFHMKVKIGKISIILYVGMIRTL